MKDNECFIKPQGAEVITIDWLNKLEILVIFKKKSFKQFIKDHGFEQERIAGDWKHANGSASLLEINGIPFFVFIFSTIDARVVVHECVHMVHNIFDAKGIDTGIDNSETVAYMTDYLFDQVCGIVDE